jgi:sugar phosphate isomerase/epimerase
VLNLPRPDEWPIATCLHGVPTTTADGRELHDAPPEAWADALALVRGVDFDLIELADSHARIGDMDPSHRSELKDVLRTAGVEAPAVHIQRKSVIQPGAGDENLAYVHRTIDAAAEWGMKVVSTGLHQPLTERQRDVLWFWTEQGPRDPADPEVWELAVARFRELGKHAAEVGLLLSLEMYEDTYLGSAESAVRLVEDIGLPNVGLNPDVGNLARLHRPVEDWRECYARTLPYANYWHLKNYARDESRAAGTYATFPTTLENGVINYRQVIADAVRAGYEGIFLMEHYGGDSLGICATNRDYVRKILRTTATPPAISADVSVAARAGNPTADR